MAIWSRGTVRKVRDLTAELTVDKSEIEQSNVDIVLAGKEIVTENLVQSAQDLGIPIDPRDVRVRTVAHAAADSPVVTIYACWRPETTDAVLHSATGEALTTVAVPNLPHDFELPRPPGRITRSHERDLFIEDTMTFTMMGWDDESRVWAYVEKIDDRVS